MALSYQEIVYTQWPTYADPPLPRAIRSAIPSTGGTRNLSMAQFFSTCPAEDAKNPVSLQTEQYRIFVCFQPMMSANAVTSKVCKFQAAL